MTVRPGGGDGLLPVDKPEGPTSHDVVAAARGALGTRRIGHTGTLDPFASGLLLLCVGRATRLAEYLHELPKSYEAVARLGRVTDTLDPEGELVEERSGWESLDEGAVLEALGRLVGPQEQEPPAFSAKKVEGEAAYRRARRGEEVRLPRVRVDVHSLELVSLDLPRVRFRARVSTGTYIRALARDLGEGLGVGAHLVALRRLSIGPFRVDRALPLEGLRDPAAVDEAWVPPLAALEHLPSVELEPPEAQRFEAGQAVELGDEAPPPPDRPLAVVSEGALLAIGTFAEGRLRPVKVFPRG